MVYSTWQGELIYSFFTSWSQSIHSSTSFCLNSSYTWFFARMESSTSRMRASLYIHKENPAPDKCDINLWINPRTKETIHGKGVSTLFTTKQMQVTRLHWYLNSRFWGIRRALLCQVLEKLRETEAGINKRRFATDVISAFVLKIHLEFIYSTPNLPCRYVYVCYHAC